MKNFNELNIVKNFYEIGKFYKHENLSLDEHLALYGLYNRHVRYTDNIRSKANTIIGIN